MFPELFKLGPITVYTYGVLLAAAYLLGLKLAMRAREGARPRSQPRARPRHCHHRLGARRRQAAAGDRRLRSLPAESRRDLLDSAGRRRVLRRPDRGHRRGVLVHAAPPDAAVDHLRRVRAGHRAGTRRRAARMSGGGLLLRASDRRAVGDHVHESGGRRKRRHAAGRAAPSDADLRKRRPSS